MMSPRIRFTSTALPSTLRPGALAAAALLLLTSCAQTPANKAAEQTPEPAPAEVVEQAPPPQPICPEPEPVEPLVCPPPPEPQPCPVCPAAQLDGKLVLGAVEYVKITPPGIIYQARIDTGAEGTSIHAANIVRFERDGEKWVKFDLDNQDGKSITLERQILRTVKVQAPRGEGERRPVVMMGVTLGSLSQQLEMSLDDRSKMSQRVLIGRNFLHNNAIVDVGQKFIAK